MGSSTWSDDAYSHMKKSYASKSTDDIFTNNKTKKASNEMLPFKVKFRESRDSDAHPETLGLMVWLDVTGSMGHIPEAMVREKLGTLMSTLNAHDLKDTQVFFGAIGDHISDKFPLQVSQFESGADELNKWLSSVYLEGAGGGQDTESYLLAWLFAARHTSIDCFEKRGQKGVLFTIGDEASWSSVSDNSLKEIMGYKQSDQISDVAILAEAKRMYHVFHIHVNEGSHRDDSHVLGYWKNLLGENLIVLEDYNQIAEVIATTVGMIHGVDLAKITKGFDPKVALGVTTALAHINTSITKTKEGALTL